MKTIELALSEIVPYENNPRFNDNAVEAVAESIREFGFQQPLVLDKDKVVIVGHTRLKAAKSLGLKTVPCIIADDLTEEQVKAYRLADNKVGELAIWDFELLDMELNEIENINMELFGFDEIVSADDFGDEFSLPDGEKNPICQMTFTLHENQKSLIEYAISQVENDIEETFGNQNKNGNALYEVIRQWAERKK